MIALATAGVDVPQESLALLVAAARDGDRGAFRGLHLRFRGMVNAIALARLRPAEAEEVCQEVFLMAWQRLPELRDLERFGPWLAQLARRRCVDRSRRRVELTGVELEAQQAPRPTLELREALAAIQSLPEAYRETLLMRLVEGMTGPEIAAATGMTPGSVRVNLHRGMSKLRASLGSPR